MSLRFDDAWLVSTVLLWVRVGALFLASPLVSIAKAPVAFIVLLTLVFAGTLAFAQDLQAPTATTATPLGFALCVITEAVVGTVLGFSIQCAMAAFGIAGQLLDVQMGFSMGSILNPVTRSSSPVLGSTLSLFAAAYFFATDAHLAIFRGLSFSVSSVPLGTPWFLQAPELIVRPVGAMFSVAVAVIAPVLFILLLVELASMVASRVLPQMNVFFVAIPAKIMIGLVVLALSGTFMAPTMSRAYADVFLFWSEVLR